MKLGASTAPDTRYKAESFGQMALCGIVRAERVARLSQPHRHWPPLKRRDTPGKGEVYPNTLRRRLVLNRLTERVRVLQSVLMPAKSIIDSLPKEKRQKVIDALMRGESLRSVAKIAGVSFQSIDAYKRKIVLPALRMASKVQAIEQVGGDSASIIESQARLTNSIVAASPFRERLEYLWGTTKKAITQAEQDKELNVMAPLLNQGHKNVELLGRVTGELEVSTPSIAIQIVCPVTDQRPSTAAAQVVDISLSR